MIHILLSVYMYILDIDLDIFGISTIYFSFPAYKNYFTSNEQLIFLL